MKLRKVISSFPVHLIVIFACFLWLIPTIGIFVTSFRDRAEILDGGWWTVFSNFKSEQEVIGIYRQNWLPSQLHSLLKETVLTTGPTYSFEPQALNDEIQTALYDRFAPNLLPGKTEAELRSLIEAFTGGLNFDRLLDDISRLRPEELSGNGVSGLVERTFEFDVEDYVGPFSALVQAPELSDWDLALRVAVSPFTTENYSSVLFDNNMANSFINSFIITVPGTLLPLLVGAFAAYAFAWMQFPGRTFLLMMVIALIVVPLQITFIPALRFFVGAGVINNSFFGIDGRFIVLWLAHTGYGLPLLVYMLRNFIGGLPKELFESAFIDGASHTTAFFRLVVPLSVPVIASMAIFQFLWVWNDLLVALIYVGGSNATSPVTLTIANMIGSRGEDWHLLTASAFISMAVPLVVFLALQRFFVRGILAGSVKG